MQQSSCRRHLGMPLSWLGGVGFLWMEPRRNVVFLKDYVVKKVVTQNAAPSGLRSLHRSRSHQSVIDDCKATNVNPN